MKGILFIILILIMIKCYIIDESQDTEFGYGDTGIPKDYCLYIYPPIENKTDYCACIKKVFDRDCNIWDLLKFKFRN